MLSLNSAYPRVKENRDLESCITCNRQSCGHCEQRLRAECTKWCKPWPAWRVGKYFLAVFVASQLKSAKIMLQEEQLGCLNGRPCPLQVLKRRGTPYKAYPWDWDKSYHWSWKIAARPTRTWVSFPCHLTWSPWERAHQTAMTQSMWIVRLWQNERGLTQFGLICLNDV